MAQFSKFKFLIALKLILMGVNFLKKYQNLVFSKSGESQKNYKNCKSGTSALESELKIKPV